MAGRIFLFRACRAQRYLLKNKGLEDNVPSFEDVTKQSNLDDGFARTFPTWFWDYDNDGWLDILAGDFTFDKPITTYSAAEALKIFNGTSGTILLYRNNRDGTFTNESEKAGTNKTAFAMSANFGDIDNDGFLDFYLGTGNPELESIVPNKMFKNEGWKKICRRHDALHAWAIYKKDMRLLLPILIMMEIRIFTLKWVVHIRAMRFTIRFT